MSSSFNGTTEKMIFAERNLRDRSFEFWKDSNYTAVKKLTSLAININIVFMSFYRSAFYL